MFERLSAHAMGYNTYNEIGVIYESTVVVRIK
jgi:hypothetical protein